MKNIVLILFASLISCSFLHASQSMNRAPGAATKYNHLITSRRLYATRSSQLDIVIKTGSKEERINAIREKEFIDKHVSNNIDAQLENLSSPKKERGIISRYGAIIKKPFAGLYKTVRKVFPF